MGQRLAFTGGSEDRQLPVIVQGTTAISIANSVVCTKTLAAAGAGVCYVVTGFSFSMASASAALTLGTVGCYVIDGASAATTFIYRSIVSVGTTGFAPIEREGLYLKGSPNTALTIEFSGAITNAAECVSIEYTTLKSA